MKQTRVKPSSLIYLVFIVLAGLVIRLLFLATPSMDSDQAVNGLMGRHILQGAFPSLWYGQDYCGSIESYLISTLFILGGASRFTLNLTICLVSLFLIIGVYFLSKPLVGQRGALLSALMTALPSYYLIFHSVLARAAYIEVPLLGTLLLIIAHRMIYREGLNAINYFLLGLISGLCIWTQLLVIFYLVPVFLLLFIRDKLLWKRSGIAFFILGILLGGLPLWSYNVIHPLATWTYLLHSSGETPFLPSLAVFFIDRFPEILGLKNNETGTYFYSIYSWLLYCLYLGLFFFACFLQRKNLFQLIKLRIPDDQGMILPLLFFLLFPFIFALTGFAGGGTSRYLVPLYSVLPVLFIWSIQQVQRYSTFLGISLLSLILFSNFLGIFQVLPLAHPQKFRDFRDAREKENRLFDFLRQKNLKVVYTPDYWNSVRLTFDSQETILFAQPTHDRYPLYTETVDRSQRIAFLFSGDNLSFEDTLRKAGGDYRKSQLYGYSLYYDFSPPPYRFTEINPTNWRVVSNYTQNQTGNSFDRDISTRWSSLEPQKPGIFVEIDLGQVYSRLSKVTLLSGKAEDFPRNLRLEISQDGKKWSVIYENYNHWGPLFWSGPHPFAHAAGDRMEVFFPPQAGRFLKLTQLGKDKNYYWSITECFIFQAEPKISERPEEVSGLIAYLKENGHGPIYTTPWIRAHLSLEMRPRSDSRKWGGDFDWIDNENIINPFASPVFVVEKDKAGALAADFKTFSLTFQQKSFGQYVIFSVSSPQSNALPISRKGWKVKTNYNSSQAKRAVDGKMGTRWTSKTPQVPGMFFQVDLGKTVPIVGLRLLGGDSMQDFPRKIQINVSADGRHWNALNPLSIIPGLYWTGERLLKYQSDLNLTLPANPTRHLHISQIGRDKHYHWSIHELLVYKSSQ